MHGSRGQCGARGRLDGSQNGGVLLLKTYTHARQPVEVPLGDGRILVLDDS